MEDNILRFYGKDNYVDFDKEIEIIEYFRDSTYVDYLERSTFFLCRCKEDSIVTSQSETYQYFIEYNKEPFLERWVDKPIMGDEHIKNRK
jgi:hypothetical protein